MKRTCFILGAILQTCVVLHAQNTPWTTNGDIGIGTTSPLSLLHVNGSIYAKSYTVYNSGDNVVQTIENGVTQHLIGTYAGWDSKAVYVAGYNANNFPAVASTERVFIGNTVNSNNYMIVNLLTGNVGIGKPNPSFKLEVNGNLYAGAGMVIDQPQAGSMSGWFRSAGNANMVLQGGVTSTTANRAWWITAENDILKMGITGGQEFPGVAAPFNISYNGSIGIGTLNINDAGYKLFVETGIRTRKVKVDQGAWADYVFDKDYTLRPLTEVEGFIHQYQHLPDVPSAEEVKKDGVDLGESQAVLLKKIEELTLYIIEQQKRIDKLEAEQNVTKQLRQQMDELKEMIKNLMK